MHSKYESEIDEEHAIEVEKQNVFWVFFNTNNPMQDNDLKYWKAHINVHPDDLDKAWELIHPLLVKTGDDFKIVDLSELIPIISKYKENVAKFEKKYEDLTKKYMSNGEFTEELKGMLKNVLSRKLEATLYGFDAKNRKLQELKQFYEGLNDETTFAKNKYNYFKDYLNLDHEDEKFNEKCFECISNQLNNEIIEAKKALASAERFRDGTQITIYMSPNREADYQKILQEIDIVLSDNNIRQGIMYKTERKLGAFVSLRHPGKGDYQAAVDVDSYNPDDVQDTFINVDKDLAFEETLSAIIAQLNRLPSPDMSEIEKDNVAVKNNLGKNLQQYLDYFSIQSRRVKFNDLANFNKRCLSAIREADTQLKHDKEWQPLLKNLALLFSGLGTIAAIISIGYRVTTGRYGLFDNKERLYDKNNIKPTKVEEEQEQEQDNLLKPE